MEIKGYYTHNGYMGYVNGTYILFATENDYLDWIEQESKYVRI